MDLSTLHHGVHKRKLKKRVGRGIGSGHGKTGSRGAVLRLRLSYCRLRLFESRAGGIGIRLGIVIIVP